jgi:hypothetical protein
VSRHGRIAAAAAVVAATALLLPAAASAHLAKLGARAGSMALAAGRSALVIAILELRHVLG